VLRRALRAACWCALLALGLAGCTTAQKAGAAAAMPLAFAGDTAIVPFQLLGYTSKALIVAGDNSNYSYSSRWGYTAVTHHDTPLSLIYYIPGYAMAPFIPFAGWDFYAMTQSCHDTLTAPRPYRRRRVHY